MLSIWQFPYFRPPLPHFPDNLSVQFSPINQFLLSLQLIHPPIIFCHLLINFVVVVSSNLMMTGASILTIIISAVFFVPIITSFLFIDAMTKSSKQRFLPRVLLMIVFIVFLYLGIPLAFYPAEDQSENVGGFEMHKSSIFCGSMNVIIAYVIKMTYVAYYNPDDCVIMYSEFRSIKITEIEKQLLEAAQMIRDASLSAVWRGCIIYTRNRFIRNLRVNFFIRLGIIWW